MGPIAFEKKEGLGILTLSRPETRNALSIGMMEEMLHRLKGIQTDESVRVVIIRAEGPVFSAGHDLKEMNAARDDIRRLQKIFSTCTEMMEKLHTLPQPVIAQVQGLATAAGCQLVAACDLAVAETGVRFSTPGVRIGLFCVTPMVPLVRLIGRRRALEMLLTGRMVPAEEALSYGLVNRLTAPDALASETEEWATRIAGFSSATLSWGKQAFYHQADLEESLAYGYAKDAMVINSLFEDAGEGISAFLEKRAPRWKGK